MICFTIKELLWFMFALLFAAPVIWKVISAAWGGFFKWLENK